MSARRRPEDAIQRAVIQHLRTRGAKNMFCFHPANGGYRKPIEAAILKGLGTVAGIPDIIVIHEGRTFALELKAPGGKPTELQLATIARMREAGADADIAVGLDQALAWLEQRGLLRGRTSDRQQKMPGHKGPGKLKVVSDELCTKVASSAQAAF